MKTKKRFLSILLTLALLLGLTPGTQMTAKATVQKTFNLGDRVTIDGVSGREWYVINQDNTTVTLFSTSCFKNSRFGASSRYSSSVIKNELRNLMSRDLASIKTALVEAPRLLTVDEALEIRRKKRNILKCGEYHWWWTQSASRSSNPDFQNILVIGVHGGRGDVQELSGGHPSMAVQGMRPAIQLDLSKVNYDEERKAFFMPPDPPDPVEAPKAVIKKFPTPNYDLIDNGQYQDLLLRDGEVENGTMVYTLVTDEPTYQELDALADSAWTTNFPQGNEAKTYYVCFKAKGTRDGVSYYEDSKAEFVLVKILQREEAQKAKITAWPQAKAGMVDNGQARELVTAGTAENGTMYYALGSDSNTPPARGAFSTAIPKGTIADTYYVWYKAVGNGNYQDSDYGCVVVSIEEYNPINKGKTDEKVEQHADTPETSVSGISFELAYEVADPDEKDAVATGADATFIFELTNADNTVPAAEKQSLENAVRREAPNAIIGMFMDLKAFFQVENMRKRELNSLNGKTVTFNIKVPKKFHAPAGIRRTFFILQNHRGKISILARTTATDIPFSAGDFSTYALAYSDENTNKEELGFNTSIKIKQSEGKIKVSWDKVNGVSEVKVYATYTGKKFPSKPVKTTKGNSVKIKKLKGKKLDLKKNFKLYLVAYDNNGNEIGKTPTAYFAGKNSDKYTNPKSIKVSNSNVSVAVGSSVKVNATIKLEDKKRKELPKKHAAKFRYRSTKDSIATVDKKGNIKGIAPGTCTVYVYAKNGLAKKVNVTVN
ncbi:Ig-like domain-containing protein [Butyrivibrio sp. FC2001]|uniref:Ig-like domain-containing protein n=1 Tax=Butyrivibrio sp. FC2001 TaxID=1280671 RepID=UPI0003F8BECC|nr:Ig-like domain-containing protein [Butyrivibrio sp. FC2001]